MRNITFTNYCNQPIWVGSWGMLPDGTKSHPLNGGWEMPAMHSNTIMVKGTLTAARFWPRTGCRTRDGGAPTLANPLRCDTGDCWSPINNGLECAGNTGVPPASLFEITFTGLGAAHDDTYDLSVVDGYNVGIAVESIGGYPLGGEWHLGEAYNCQPTKCVFDYNKNCPPELLYYPQGSDKPAACASPCSAVKGSRKNPTLDYIRTHNDSRTGYPLTNLVCCDCAAGPSVGCNDARCQYGCSPFDTSNPGGKCLSEHWPKASTGQDYSEIYKQFCPDTYAWQFADQTSTFHCINADYAIHFCPENKPSSASVEALKSNLHSTEGVHNVKTKVDAIREELDPIHSGGFTNCLLSVLLLLMVIILS